MVLKFAGTWLNSCPPLGPQGPPILSKTNIHHTKKAYPLVTSGKSGPIDFVWDALLLSRQLSLRQS